MTHNNEYKFARVVTSKSN